MKCIIPKSPEVEFKENPEISREEIQKLREWLRNQPHLPQDITDLTLILAYYSCQQSMELTKHTIDLHYTLRSHLTPYFKDRDVDTRAKSVNNAVLIAPLESHNPEGHRGLYCCLLDNDPKHFNFPDTLRHVMMVIDLWQLEDGTWPGFIIMIDMDSVVLGHLARLEISAIRHALYFLQEAMLVRLKGFHFLNAPPFMDRLLMMIKPFINKNLMDYLHVHQAGSNTLEEFFPMNALPREAGGTSKSKNTYQEEVWDRLQANNEYFIEENKLRVNESLRQDKTRNVVSEMFGLEGNFKKLDID